MNKTTWDDCYKMYKLAKELGFNCNMEEYEDVMFSFVHNYTKYDSNGKYINDVGDIRVYSPLTNNTWKVIIDKDYDCKTYELFSIDGVIEMVKSYDSIFRE